MHSSFQCNQYLLRRQVLALTGTFRLYDPSGRMLMFSKQKMFRLREDIRVYADEGMTQPMLLIKARNIIDFSAAYDVIDPQSNEKVGVWRRKGWRSLLRDEWELLDESDRQIGILVEDSVGYALLRRLLLGRLLPQNYDLFIGNTRVGDFRQRFHLFRYELDIDFQMDTAHKLDRRMGVAAAILLGTIEGKQESS